MFIELLRGLLVTLELFVVCWAFSIPFGLLLCFVRKNSLKFFRFLIDTYIC